MSWPTRTEPPNQNKKMKQAVSKRIEKQDSSDPSRLPPPRPLYADDVPL